MKFIKLFESVIQKTFIRVRNVSQMTKTKHSYSDYATAIYEFIRNSIYWDRYKYQKETGITGAYAQCWSLKLLTIFSFIDFTNECQTTFGICNGLCWQSTMFMKCFSFLMKLNSTKNKNIFV